MHITWEANVGREDRGQTGGIGAFRLVSPEMT